MSFAPECRPITASKFGIDSTVTHRYLQPLIPPPRPRLIRKLVVGHIGSLYSIASSTAFVTHLAGWHGK